METSSNVRVVGAAEARVARQAAREAFEGHHLAMTGKHLPRADGDLWWPDTEPRTITGTPAPAPLSRAAEIAHRPIRSGWGQ